MQQSTRALPLTDEERQRLRIIRLERRWSYDRLAAEIGLPRNTVKNVIEGRHPRSYEPTVYHIRKWLEAQPVEIGGTR